MTDLDQRATAPVSAFDDDALGHDDAVGLTHRLASGEVSSRELVEAAIARAERVDPALNAVSVWDRDRALEQSAEPGEGVFAGIPTFVKAVSAVAGLPNRWGSRAVPDTPAAESGPEVVQFLSTGLVSLETGYTICKVRTAADGGIPYIVASSYEGTVLGISYEGKTSNGNGTIRWFSAG